MKNQIETWKDLTKENFKIGDRICQSHFPQDILVNCNYYNIYYNLTIIMSLKPIVLDKSFLKSRIGL